VAEIRLQLREITDPVAPRDDFDTANLADDLE
jgi:hypothetical protein